MNPCVSTEFFFRVAFPASVRWMVLELDPRSGTSQPEDSLTIFMHARGDLIPITPGLDNFVQFHNSKRNNRYVERRSETEWTDDDGFVYSPTGDVFEPLLHKMSNV